MRCQTSFSLSTIQCSRRHKMYRMYSGTRSFLFQCQHRNGEKKKKHINKQIFHGCSFVTLLTNHFPDLPGKTIAAVTSADMSVSVDQGKLLLKLKKWLFSSIIQPHQNNLRKGSPYFLMSSPIFCLFCFQYISIILTHFCSLMAPVQLSWIYICMCEHRT